MPTKIRSFNLKSDNTTYPLYMPSHADLVEGLKEAIDDRVEKISPELTLSKYSTIIPLDSIGR